MVVAALAVFAWALLAPVAIPLDDDGHASRHGNPIALGMLTLPDDALADSRVTGARLALDMLAAQGGPALQLHVGSASGRWDGVADAARRLICEVGCQGLIAPPDGDATHLIEQLAARMHLPVALLGGDGSLTRVPLPWVARIVPDHRTQLRTLLDACNPARDHGATSTPPQPIPALLPGGRAGRRARQDLSAVARTMGLAIQELPVSFGADVAHMLQRQGGPRTGPVIVWLDDPMARDAVAALDRGGWTGPVLLPSHVFAGHVLAGHIPTGQWTDAQPIGNGDLRAVRLASAAPTRQTDAFASAYRLAYGHDPDEAAAFAFDAALALAHLLTGSSHGTDPWLPLTRIPFKPAPTQDARSVQTVRTPVLLGVTGPLLFDDTGERLQRFAPWRARQRPAPSADRHPPPHIEG